LIAEGDFIKVSKEKVILKGIIIIQIGGKSPGKTQIVKKLQLTHVLKLITFL
jgi:hypothetical protein